PTDLEVWTAKLERFAATIQDLPLRQIAQTTAETLEELKQFVKSPEMARIVNNADALIAHTHSFVEKLDAQAGPLVAQTKGTLSTADAALNDARQLVGAVTAQVGPLTGQADATLKAAQTTVQSLEPLVADMQRLVARVDAQTDPLLLSFRTTSDAARVTMERAQLTLSGVDRTFDQESPLGYEAVQALQEIRNAARALRSLAEFFERMPDAAVYGLRRPTGESN
ncbi:MAG TPA: hypothetical protein VEL75_20085, partial [Candidatus Methylomirabilis sp.]|nr:hypothetical protein [Candidatus Methylomirabilis sp.]